ncbi:MAG: S1/P1 nuclease [Acidobacteria bacterium]|nr:S1/P1 nuclease [Acidobacteriota bacterium]
MKRVARSLIWMLALILLAMSLAPASVLGWGAQGHRLVARTAQQKLSTKAQQEVRRLLGAGVTLESVANWADAVRNQRKETKNWHFVDIPRNASTYDPARDCPRTPFGDCIINALAESRSTLSNPNALEHFRDVLANPQESLLARAEALKFLVHFMGDLHQPLHCADDHDRGGNDVHVTFFGASSNLHKVWDTDILAKAGLRQTINRLSTLGRSWNDTAAIQGGTFQSWALEAHSLAAVHAYQNIPSNKRLGQRYYQDNRPIVEGQLLKAGLRLAQVLNEIFHE